MNRIKEIIESRLSPHYYTDCVKGQRINKQRELWITELVFELEEMKTNDLLDLMEETVDPAMVRGFYSEFGIDPNYPRVSFQARQVAEALTLDATVKRRVQKMTKKLGCLGWKQCALCPDGLELFARQIHDYTMGGFGS